MVAFTEELRHRCRKCRGKLPQPTSNEREGFCCRGCYEQFYWKRCRVCECDIEQGKGTQRIVCDKPKCKSAWRSKAGFGRFLAAKTPNPSHTSSAAIISAETLVPQRVLSASKAVGWRIVAGPALSPDVFQAATAPDGPSQWSGGSFQRVEAGNRALMRKHADAEHHRSIRHAFAIEREARWSIHSHAERLAA